MKLSKHFIVVGIVLPFTFFLSPFPSLHAEDVKISTYYPSPFGNYRNLTIDDADPSTTTPTQNGALTVSRLNDHLGSHIAFLKDDDATAITSLGYERSTNYFGFGTGGLGAFSPTYLSFSTGTNGANAAGFVGIGIAHPNKKLHIVEDDTVFIPDVIEIDHTNSAGVGAVNFGSSIVFTGECSAEATNNLDPNLRRPLMARLRTIWLDPTVATRTSAMVFETKDDDGGVPLVNHMFLSSTGLNIVVEGGTLRVPTKTDNALDPAGAANSMIYYNVPAGKFRVFEGGVWTNMTGGGGAGGGAVPSAIVVFDTVGTLSWTAPVGVTKINVQVWGGGGGGGGATSCSGGGNGGGGGGYAESIRTVTPGTTYTVVVGAGGIGNPNLAGTNGSISYFGTAATVSGGGGAAGLRDCEARKYTAPGGNGIGQITISGGDGVSGENLSAGGDSPFGGSGGVAGQNLVDPVGNGGVGKIPGGGGGGGGNAGAASGSGGVGAHGRVVIKY